MDAAKRFSIEYLLSRDGSQRDVQAYQLDHPEIETDQTHIGKCHQMFNFTLHIPKYIQINFCSTKY